MGAGVGPWHFQEGVMAQHRLCYAHTSRLFPGPSSGTLAESVPCKTQPIWQPSVGAPGCPSLLALLLDLLASAATVADFLINYYGISVDGGKI